MRGLWHDVVYGLRSFLRKPAFFVAALLSLTLGIGTTTAIFTLLQSIFLNPLPVEDLDRLVSIARTMRNDAGEYVDEHALSYPNYLDFAERNQSFEEIGVYHWWPMYLTGGGESQRITGMFVSGNYFDLLGVEPGLGRLLRPADTDRSSPPVAVLAEATWRRSFAADPDVLGTTIQVNGVSLTVVGVAPRGFRGTDMQAAVDLFVPLQTFETISPYGSLFENRAMAIFPGLGRLKDGVSVEQASAEIHALQRQLAAEYPDILDELGAKAQPLAKTVIRLFDRERYAGYGKRLLLVGLILLIACLSVANLLFVRGVERARELAVRQALGAGRRRLLRQLLTENLLLFVLGGLGALAVTKLFLTFLWRFRPPEVPGSALDLSLGVEAMAFGLGVALAVGLVFGIVPALRAARADLVSDLKESEPLAERKAVPTVLRPRSLVVMLQVALALMALIGAGLLLRSLQRMYHLDLGFDSDRLAVLSVAPGDQGYDQARTDDFYRRLLEEVRSLPGVTAAGLSHNRLLRGAPWNRQVYLPGNDSAIGFGAMISHRVNIAAAGFFEAAGIDIIEGRGFREEEPGERLAVVINQTMAEQMWPGKEPVVGSVFTFDFPSGNDEAVEAEVIGVFADTKVREIRDDRQFFMYLSSAQVPATTMTLHARTEGDPAALLPLLRETVRRLDPNLAQSDVATMRSFVDDAMWLERTSTRLLGLFGLLALALALVGVYGLLAYSVNSRQREIGILIALGAGRGQVLKAVLSEALQVAAAGVVLGLVGAVFFLKRFMQTQLHDVSSLDLPTYALWSLVLLLAALLGSFLPAWRAAHIDPNQTLRAE